VAAAAAVHLSVMAAAEVTANKMDVDGVCEGQAAGAWHGNEVSKAQADVEMEDAAAAAVADAAIL
jgi:hypothetical protein